MAALSITRPRALTVARSPSRSVTPSSAATITHCFGSGARYLPITGIKRTGRGYASWAAYWEEVQEGGLGGSDDLLAVSRQPERISTATRLSAVWPALKALPIRQRHVCDGEIEVRHRCNQDQRGEDESGALGAARLHLPANPSRTKCQPQGTRPDG
jgi:hypothetical protein